MHGDFQTVPLLEASKSGKKPQFSVNFYCGGTNLFCWIPRQGVQRYARADMIVRVVDGRIDRRQTATFSGARHFRVTTLRVGQFLSVCLFAAICWSGFAPPVHGADDDSVLQKAHAWGRFGKGSWRYVQVIIENFDGEGRLVNSSTTDNLTTLDDVTADHATLRVEVTVEIAGQRFPSQPQILKQGYAGENVGQTVSIKPLQPEAVVVDGRQIRCETEQIEILGGASKETSLISFAPRLTPAILKRTSTMRDVASSKTTQESHSEVYALDRPIRVFDGIQNGYSVKLVQKNDHGVTITWSDHVPDVPGEIVAQSSKKLDSQGRLVRRSTLELVAYGFDGEEYYRELRGRRAYRAKRAR
jgi:hypothetical protein